MTTNDAINARIRAKAGKGRVRTVVASQPPGHKTLNDDIRRAAGYLPADQTDEGDTNDD